MNDELMDTLLWEGESSSLDYKREQYRFNGATDQEKSELLKDILAFANRWTKQDAHILIGVDEVKGARSVVLGITEHLDDSSLQQFVNGKTNRSVVFSYRTYAFEGKQIGIIKIAVQERPIYVRSRYGKIEKEVVYYRQGTSTAVATPDDIKRMAAPSEGKQPPASAAEERVRVKIGIDFPSGLYADVYNSGEVTLYVKQVALVSEFRDETKSPPFDLVTTQIPLLATISMPLSGGGTKTVALGPHSADIDPRREVRFVLPKGPSAMLEALIKPPRTTRLSVKTFGGEIHAENDEGLMLVLEAVIKGTKAQEEAAKPKTVSFSAGEGTPVIEAYVQIARGDDRRIRTSVKKVIDGFVISKEELGQVIAEMDAGKVCGRVGKYQWML